MAQISNKLLKNLVIGAFILGGSATLITFSLLFGFGVMSLGFGLGALITANATWQLVINATISSAFLAVASLVNAQLSAMVTGIVARFVSKRNQQPVTPIEEVQHDEDDLVVNEDHEEENDLVVNEDHEEDKPLTVTPANSNLGEAQIINEADLEPIEKETVTVVSEQKDEEEGSKKSYYEQITGSPFTKQVGELRNYVSKKLWSDKQAEGENDELFQAPEEEYKGPVHRLTGSPAKELAQNGYNTVTSKLKSAKDATAEKASPYVEGAKQKATQTYATVSPYVESAKQKAAETYATVSPKVKKAAVAFSDAAQDFDMQLNPQGYTDEEHQEYAERHANDKGAFHTWMGYPVSETRAYQWLFPSNPVVEEEHQEEDDLTSTTTPAVIDESTIELQESGLTTLTTQSAVELGVETSDDELPQKEDQAAPTVRLSQSTDSLFNTKTPYQQAELSVSDQEMLDSPFGKSVQNGHNSH